MGVAVFDFPFPLPKVTGKVGGGGGGLMGVHFGTKDLGDLGSKRTEISAVLSKVF